MKAMLLEIENRPAVLEPSSKQMVRLLKGLRSYGPSSFATLSSHEMGFIQVAGGGVGCVLERRLHAKESLERAYLMRPVAVFPDGTRLQCNAGSIEMRSDEWFTIDQVVEVFCAFRAGEPLPAWVFWRDLSGRLFPSSK